MSSEPAYEAVVKARNQDSSGNPEGAVKTLEAYLETDPHNVYARMELARIYSYGLRDKDQGVFQLEIILDIDPDNIEALKAMTTVRAVDKGRTAQTDKQFLHLIELVEAKGDKKEYASVCSAYAVFLRKQKINYEISAEYYEKAIAADPDRYEYHQDYAVLLLNEYRDYIKARHELEEVLRIKPDNDSARKNLNRLISTKFDANGNVKLNFFERLRLNKK